MTRHSIDATNLEVALGVAAERAERTGETACVYRDSAAWSVAGTEPPYMGWELIADVEPGGRVTRYDRPEHPGGDV